MSHSYVNLRIAKYGLLILFAPSCAQTEVSTEKRPNVILIMTDDQGYGDLACHGNPIIKTPNLDKFHSESIHLTNFHVNPFCAPTRAALMTGRMSDRTHVRTTVYARNYLNREETTMAEFFKTSGYHTGIFGKWHLGQNYPYRPIDRGFDHWVGHGDGGTGTASDYWDNDKMNDTYIVNGKWEKFEGYINDIFFNEAMEFISKKKNEPFFIYLATNIPHSPWNVLNEWREEYSNANLKESEMDFLSTISRFDRNFGRLREFMHQNNLDENTILIFLTDNGTSGGNEIFNAGMRGRKGSVYEGGHRVPCFIHWPGGNLNKPVNIDLLTAHIDILPTLIEMCGLESPEHHNPDFDGISLVPFLNNDHNKNTDRVLFLHSQNLAAIPVRNINSLVATEEWRFINGEELYDIKNDPRQNNNIAGQHTEVLSRLSEKYNSWWDELNMENYPLPRPIIGSIHDEETWLTCDAWILDKPKPDTWDQSHVLAGADNNGYWPVEIAVEGRYQFEVRRWPREINHPINASLPANLNGDISQKGKKLIRGEGRKINSVKVQLKLDDREMEKPVNDQDTHVLFVLDLKPGPKTVRAGLIDVNGKKQGAYYVYVKKI